jgi:FHA domain
MRDPPYGELGTDQPTRMWGAPPRLVVTSNGDLFGRQVPLTGDAITIGRAEGNHLRLDDPYVSRHHALVRVTGDVVLIEDNASSGGVHVNGRRIDRPTTLQPGDVVRLGRLDLQVQADHPAARRTPPAEGPPAGPPVAGPLPVSAVQTGGGRYDIGRQQAGEIYNVGGDYNRHQYYQLKIAPMRRRARILLRLGVALFLTGFGVYGYAVFRGVLNVFGLIGEPLDPSTPPDFGGVFEPVIRYTPIGLALLFAGLVLIVTGLLMRRSASAKERQL